MLRMATNPPPPVAVYGWQADSLHAFLKALAPLQTRIPRNGVTCYLGSGGVTPRREYLWLVYGLAPRVVVPWQFAVDEGERGLKQLAPSLLWHRSFDPVVCDRLLMRGEGVLPAGFGEAQPLNALEMSLYERS
jgi:hypothetical protein